MAIYTNLPVYKVAYDLMLAVTQALPNLPRESRYTLGQDLTRRVMDILVRIYRANSTRRKQPVIARMRELVVETQVTLRLLCDMRHLPEKRYLAMASQTASLSKQLAAWERSEREKEKSAGGTAAKDTVADGRNGVG